MSRLTTAITSITKTQIGNNSSLSYIRKMEMANKFTPVKINAIAKREDGLGVDNKHTHLIHNASGKIALKYTSTHISPTGTSLIRISDEKANGKVIPAKDPITKKIKLDVNGNEIPSQVKGGQYIWVMDKPLISEEIPKTQGELLTNNTSCLTIKQDHQSFTDQHEDKLEIILLAKKALEKPGVLLYDPNKPTIITE